ncbi:hypothetical protein Syun_000914 [Stephania yunnanensis]|uniref:Uncharacterized protein n=1 Tax=Stephania yunnanensis TaxID=152371 RepID=A0AAP0Q784_9MAGN
MIRKHLQGAVIKVKGRLKGFYPCEISIPYPGVRAKISISQLYETRQPSHEAIHGQCYPDGREVKATTLRLHQQQDALTKPPLSLPPIHQEVVVAKETSTPIIAMRVAPLCIHDGEASTSSLAVRRSPVKVEAETPTPSHQLKAETERTRMILRADAINGETVDKIEPNGDKGPLNVDGDSCYQVVQMIKLDLTYFRIQT